MARSGRFTSKRPAGSDAAQLYHQAVQAFQAGHYGKAAQLTQRILKHTPGHTQTMLLRASALVRNDQPDDARRLLNQLLKRHPEHHHLHHEIALSWMLQGNMDNAHRAIDKALAVSPDNAMYLAAKAELYQAQDQYEAGFALLEPIAARKQADARSLIVFAELASELGRAETALAAIDRALTDKASLTSPLERRALFARVSILDKAGNHLEAFDAAQHANTRAQELRGGPFNVSLFQEQIQQVVDNWKRQSIAALPARGEPSDMPIFIVGMPRSGTSLVEQILSSHPQVVGAGELGNITRFVHEVEPTHAQSTPVLTDPKRVSTGQLSRFARSYLRELRTLGQGAARVTDKNPMNFLNLGLVQRAFPNCHVIWCVRQPLDVGVSCFFHDFKGDLRWTNDLKTLGQCMLEHDRLLDHWQRELDIPILQVAYESLVNDLQSSVRQLLDHVGLPFDQACVDFHRNTRMVQTASMHQVRQPIYTSAVNRASRYGDRLYPLRTVLEANKTKPT